MAKTVITLKYLSLIYLVLSSLSLLKIENAGLCVMGYYEQGIVTYFKDMTGSGGSDDPAVFGAAAYMGLLFSLFFLFPLTKPWFIGLFSSLLLVQFLIFALVDIPLNDIVYDSVKYCQNDWMLTWLILEFLFILCSVLLIRTMKYLDEE